MNQKLNALVDRLEVIATSIVTWIGTAIIVLNLLLTQDWVLEIDGASQVIGQLITFLGGFVLLIRRVTPVDKDDRGLLA